MSKENVPEMNRPAISKHSFHQNYSKTPNLLQNHEISAMCLTPAQKTFDTSN